MRAALRRFACFLALAGCLAYPDFLAAQDQPPAATAPAEHFVTQEAVETVDLTDAAARAPAGCSCQPYQPPAECNCPACQTAKKAADLKTAVAGAYAPLFYNNNFAYINNPAYNDWYPGDYLKQMPIGDCWILDMGGQYRARYHHEQNMR